MRALGGPTDWAGWEQVTVDKHHVLAPEISLEKAREMQGRIVVDEGQLIHQQPALIGLQMEPVDRLPFADEDLIPVLEQDGHFVFHKLFQGKYWVNVTQISPGYYVSAISSGSRDGLTEPVQLGDGDLTVTVRSDGPLLSGTVTTENGRELRGRTVVMLSSADRTKLTVIRSAPVDQNGRFSFDNIPPGKFAIVALSGVNSDDVGSPTLFSQFSSQAKELDLPPHSNQQIEIHPIPVS